MAPRYTSVLIEADGGSRGNPGQAAYGAVLMDAETREVIAERAECIGIATNNVAEYRGLIAGLELFNELAPEADLEVRMDSKLVVEQMSGNWKIKHPDMKPLAMAAHRLAPFGTTYTWIPREQNKHADRILNEALDGKRTASEPVEDIEEVPVADADRPAPRRTAGSAGKAGAGERTAAEGDAGSRGWGPPGVATTLVLVRHGATVHTLDKRFSGGLQGSNPGLSPDGRAQVRATADWLAPLADEIDGLVSSPVRRSVESAEILGERLGKPVATEPGLAEMEFGDWEGLTFEEVRAKYADDLDAWLGSVDHPAGGGESFSAVQQRVQASLERLLADHAGKTLLVVSHVTPIKVLVARALGAPLDAVYRMELAAASVTVLSFYDDGRASMRLFNARPMEEAFIGL